MKIGDLVHIKPGPVRRSMYDVGGKLGMVVYITEPSPIMPYQIVRVLFEGMIHRDISHRYLEVVSAGR